MCVVFVLSFFFFSFSFLGLLSNNYQLRQIDKDFHKQVEPAEHSPCEYISRAYDWGILKLHDIHSNDILKYSSRFGIWQFWEVASNIIMRYPLLNITPMT